MCFPSLAGFAGCAELLIKESNHTVIRDGDGGVGRGRDGQQVLRPISAPIRRFPHVNCIGPTRRIKIRPRNVNDVAVVGIDGER